MSLYQTIRSVSSRRRGRGFVSLEVILVLPMLLLLLLGLLEFSILFSARGQVIDAAQAGARFATLHGVQAADVETEIQHTLTPNLAKYAKVETRIGQFSGEEVLVRIRVPMSAATPDLLWPIGYSIRNQELVGEARMLKE